MSNNKNYTGGISPEYALLGFLMDGPSHAYELHQRLNAAFGTIWHINQSQIYAICKRLERERYVASRLVVQEKLPARQVLEITPRGQARFEAWLNNPTFSGVRAIRLEFVTRLYFLHKMKPERLPEVLAQQSTFVQGKIAQLHADSAGSSVEELFAHLGDDLRIRQLNTVLDWIEDVEKTLLDQPETVPPKNSL